MKLVSNNTEEDLAKARSQDVVEWAARDLAANLLRVIRGAGRPHELVRQAAEFVQAADNFFEVHRVQPFNEIANAVSLPERRPYVGRTEADFYIELGQSTAIRGALQVVASELLGQRTQVAAGESELFDGINSVEKGRELNRRQWDRPPTERPKARGGTSKKKPKPKPKAKPKV